MKKDINIEVGARIKEKRKNMKYTREALSELIDISPQFLAQIESGKKGMSFTTLSKLSQVLGVSCDYLILGKKEKEETRLNELSESISSEYIPIAEDMLGCLLRTIATAKKGTANTASPDCKTTSDR